MENVMKSAWEIAYGGAAKFGGQVKEYFSEALKIAWDLFKKGGSEMVTSEWNVQRGFRKVPVKMVTKPNSDGVEIVEITSNGETFTNCEYVKHGGNWAVKVICPINGVSIFKTSPEVNASVWGHALPIIEAPVKKKTSKSNFCRRCHSYCWGDCQAN